MNDTTFSMTPTLRERVAAIASARGRWIADADRLGAAARTGSAHGRPRALCTVGDYMSFIRMWLNDGAGEAWPGSQAGDGGGGGKERARRQEDRHAARRDQIAIQRRGVLPRPVEILGAELHGQRRTGADRDAPPGRSVGPASPTCSTGSTASNGCGGFWATQILPFGDPASFGGYMKFETAFYDALAGRKAA